MRQFASGGLRIWNLGREAKLVYTGFGLFALLALLCSVALYDDMVGWGARGVRAYYAGEAAAPAPPAAPPAGAPGPRIEMPEDEPGRMTVAVSYRKLLEVSHFHLFTVPVFVLIIAHLFMLTGLSVRAKLLWIGGGWLSSLLHLLAPWLIRYGSPRLGVLFPLSGAAMALTLGVMTVYPIVVMWARRPARPGAAA
jgi:hypothetical protein